MPAPTTPPPMTRRAPGATLPAGIVAVILLAFLITATTSNSGLWWRFSTFTYEVNLVAAGYFAWALVRPESAARRPGLRGAVTLYVVVAGVIWNLFLTDMSMGYSPQNILLHVISPILIGLDWLLIGRNQDAVRWWHPVAWLAYPLIYLVGTLIYLNLRPGRFLYFFLDLERLGVAGLAQNIALLAIGFAALGYLLLGIGRLAVTARRRAIA